MKTHHAISFSLVLGVLGLLAMPQTAHAHPRGMAVRVGLGIPALSVVYYPRPERLQVLYGLNQYTFGAHLGLQVSPEIGLILHALAGGAYVEESPAGPTHELTVSVAPRVEYMFYPHDTFAPYLGGEVGYTATGDPDANMLDVFRGGGFVGAHVFALTRFSIDLELAANFLYDVDNGRAGFQGTLYLSTTGWLD